ncbi:hypothetical protein QCA50_018526 [Cerrena zonata]|uniref:Cytochrome P450 n=1 Tax=Cerrena zonata TaxID=2478898 RepID=A0AAW0FMB7_9APHY
MTWVRTFATIILTIAYDMDISDSRDEYVLLVQEAVEGISIVTVPVIYWITEYYRPIVENMVNKPFDEIKQGMGSTKTSNPIDDKIARNVASVAYATAADTIEICSTLHAQTTSAGRSFLVSMLLYPDVQREAHEQLYRIVELNRLPDFEDYHELLYIKAVLLEVMLGWSLPRRVIRNNEYKGYIIPKGTIDNPNIWLVPDDSTRMFVLMAITSKGDLED